MKTTQFFCLALLTALFVACDDSGDELKVKKEIFGGYAQKGPFVNGSSVTISELDANLDQTGRVYLTTISDNSGRFEKKNIELVSNYVELKADGYYFNEISGQTSAGQMTLYALVDVKDVNSANVNVLTHLEKLRVEYLVKQEGMPFSAAKQQAQREVLAIFGFEPPETSSEALNLTDNATLLAISCILQGYLSTGDMMELMANICADIKQDGVLNPALGSKLTDYAFAVSLSLVEVRNNLTTKYAEFSSSNVTIPDFESYIRLFLESGLYPRTLFITYPATGLFGDNILSDAVTSLKGESTYSMRAEVPKGQSLKITVSGEHNTYNLIGGNWEDNAGDYDSDNFRHTFFVVESGNHSDGLFRVVYQRDIKYEENREVVIKYYENSSTTPTKVKTLHIED